MLGVLADAGKSLGRAYINNFQDKGKQSAIDMLLVRTRSLGLIDLMFLRVKGNLTPQVLIFDPIHDSVRATLKARYVVWTYCSFDEG